MDKPLPLRAPLPIQVFTWDLRPSPTALFSGRQEPPAAVPHWEAWGQGGRGDLPHLLLENFRVFLRKLPQGWRILVREEQTSSCPSPSAQLPSLGSCWTRPPFLPCPGRGPYLSEEALGLRGDPSHTGAPCGLCLEMPRASRSLPRPGLGWLEGARSCLSWGCLLAQALY